MPQLYLNLPTIFIEITSSCTKLSVHTCFNQAGRLRYQVPSIKTNISSDLIKIILSTLHAVFVFQLDVLTCHEGIKVLPENWFWFDFTLEI